MGLIAKNSIRIRAAGRDVVEWRWDNTNAKLELIVNDVVVQSLSESDAAALLTNLVNLTLTGNLTLTDGYIQNSVSTGLTAHAGGGQTSALALVQALNVVTVVATAGDSVRLPASATGRYVVIVNAAALPLQVFGASTDTINGVATATGVPLPAGNTGIYYCNAAGTWFTSLRQTIAYSQYAAASNTTAFTATGAQVAGANNCVLDCTGALGSGQALTLPTVAAFVAALPNAYVGQTTRLRIMNRSSGAFAWTVTTNTGWTLTGTMTIAQNTYRDFQVTLTSLSAAVLQSLGQVIVAT